MGFWARLKRIFSTNVNAALDAVEDKELALDQLVRDMQTEHRKTKGFLAEAIVHLKKLERDSRKHRAAAENYVKKAKAILSDDDESNDYLAKECLSRKKDEERIAAQYEKAAETQRVQVDKLKKNIQQMEKKIEGSKRKKQILVAKKQMAETQMKVAETSSYSPDNEAFAAFNRMEEEIDDMSLEAEAKMELTADAGKDIDAQLEEIGFESEVEDEFLLLKQEVAGQLTADAGKEAAD